MIQYPLKNYIRYMRSVLWRHHKSNIISSIVATFLFGLFIKFLNHFYYDIHFWDQFNLKQSALTWFCEYTDPKKLIRQPINTFTNFVYMVNAVYFFNRGYNDYVKKTPYNLITSHPFYSFVLCAISLYTFAGSTFYHSSLVEKASTIDFSAVYSVSLFPLMYFSHRILLYYKHIPSHMRNRYGLFIHIAIFTFIYLMLTFVISMEYTHEIVLVFIISTGIFGFILEQKERGKTNKLYLQLMVITISIAILFFKLDIEKVFCDPNSYFQPHSIWHLFNGFAVFYFYLYIRSESYIPNRDKKVMQLKEMHLFKQ